MIKELTQEQMDEMPKYVDKWIALGTNTDPLNFNPAKKCVDKIYEQANLAPPKYVFQAQSPLSAAYVEVILKALPWATAPKSKTDNEFADNVWKMLLPQLPKELRPKKPAQTWNWIKDKIANNLNTNLRNALNGQSYGCQGHWLSFYDYMLNVVGLKEEVKMVEVFIELAKHCGWWTACEEVAILQDRPSKIHFNEEKQLHKDGGAAILYRDGFAVFALNGVRVPEWLATEPSGQIDAKKIKTVDNAEVRREFVRKVGLERIKHVLKGKTIDSKTVLLATPENPEWECTYQLIELDFGNNSKRRVLEFQNASLPELSHVEYVRSECATVESAINFRLNRTEKDVCDETGAEWFLHGDVIVKPKDGNEKWKRWPKTIA